ncbi:MAG TPA: hypothetical protein VEH27_14645 [Methylomirabilota bacterium]|nr:hypothetical protein [Methylomirabilota bacterium]
MAENKGNPGGKNAANKSDSGRKDTQTKRQGDSTNAPTQRLDAEGNEAGRNRKAGAPD